MTRNSFGLGKRAVPVACGMQPMRYPAALRITDIHIGLDYGVGERVAAVGLWGAGGWSSLYRKSKNTQGENYHIYDLQLRALNRVAIRFGTGRAILSPYGRRAKLAMQEDLLLIHLLYLVKFSQLPLRS